jgi:multidrug efflux system membrane fusion protein
MSFFKHHRMRIAAKLESLVRATEQNLSRLKTRLHETDWPDLAKKTPGKVHASARHHVAHFRARRPRDQWLIGSGAFVLVLAGFALIGYLNGDSSPLKRGKPPIPVAVQPVVEGVFPILVDGLGTVTARREVVIRTRIDGQLDKVLFQEGQMVKAGDLIAVVDPRIYEAKVMQAKGKLDQDEALLKDHRIKLKRYQTLYKQDSIARQDLDSQAALVLQFEGAVETDKGSLADAKTQLSYTQITAPFDGRLGLRKVDAGNIVKTSDTIGIVTLTQVQPIDVLFTIPSDQLPKILARFNAGDAMPVSAYDRNFRTVIATGVLKSIDNVIDATTGMVKLKAEFTNDDNALFPNQFVNARLLVEDRDQAIIAPSNAILRGSQGTYVYVVGADQAVAAKTVKLGGVQGPQAEILEGLTAGDSVVVDGFDKLKPGAKVNVVQRPTR